MSFTINYSDWKALSSEGHARLSAEHGRIAVLGDDGKPRFTISRQTESLPSEEETTAIRAEVARASIDIKARDARVVELNGMLDESRAEVVRLTALLNQPELHDFAAAVALEAAHQRSRWGPKHDSGKTPADWFWLVGYLAGKALHAQTSGNVDKALHHTISTAAVLSNWHASICGMTDMRPGLSADVAEDDHV